MRKPNKYTLLLVLTVVGYVLFDYYRPKPLDWTPTYRNDNKIPFGTQALYELLPDLLSQPAVPTVRTPVYNFLTETKLPTRSNYVLIAHDFKIDRNDQRELLRYVERGNTVLVSAYQFPDSLSRQLGFKADEQKPQRADTTLRQYLVNPRLSPSVGYTFRHDDGRNFIRILKSATVTVLARNARREPTFIRVRYGRGQFLIHNLPLAFTNYYVLDPKSSDYAFNALSYLPTAPTYWDEYQKQGRFGKEEQSIFRYVWSQPALNWAYYLVVFGVLFYVLFAGKRTQRVIPVVEPPRNTSLEFVETIGQLYFQQGNHDNLARQRVQYFLADLRERYGLNTTTLDTEFTTRLSQKSGLSADEAADLTRLLRDARRSVSLSEFDLLRLNRAMEQFYASL
ncbi:DUF4350 domain-containing protein [Spirosoma rhododendri]|uniref:DUF4350 domain-containing protein n=1 Tax=Spirosoma rhododendri TaxID=2728024 RepID=A0A7L5DIY1_9BACT|nr:DUF4350 domain-containing protein [Spirosoma rhododendri]QJD78346.1 DUF4350 domain-containing protein [Spirosoma rhododendri]